MSTITPLPASLRARLAALGWRIRLLRVVRGIALLVAVLGCVAAAAVLVDSRLDLPAQARQILFLTWIAVAIAWLLRSAIVPLCRRIDAAALAALIEEKYPDLGERLSTAVELSGASAEGHGSPLLIALLLQETAARIEQVDFRSVVPARRAAVLTVLAAALTLLIATPVLLWPQLYGTFAQRFFRPWDVAAVEASADIPATPRLPAVPLVELAADSPTITVTPPAYAGSVKQVETFHGLVDLAPLQYSEIRFAFRFTRPAVAAYLEEVREETIRHKLVLSADRQAAALMIPAIRDCKYRLILEAESDTRTELPGGSIQVQLDQPPSVRRFTGKEYLRSVLPYERIPFEIEATDDIGVSGIELEYRLNDGETRRQPMDVQGRDTPFAFVRHVLELTGKVQENDRFSYRFRVSDNLPKEHEGPHVIFYPPEGWLTVQIARRGDLLQEQEIAAQRKEIDRRLQAIREALLREQQGVGQLQEEKSGQAPLPPDRLDRIQQLQRENRSNQHALNELAQLAEASTAQTPLPPAAEATPDAPLQPVGELARKVANQEMRKSQQALDQAPQEEAPAEQLRQLETTAKMLGSAIRRLEELKKLNDRLAQERLDRIKLEMLAEKEKHLAEKTAELAAKQPEFDPQARELAEKLKGEQADAAAELERLAQRNEALKQALEQARAEQAQQLAERAQELAQTQRDVMKAQEDAERKLAANHFAELARKQQELAKQQDKLAQQTRSAATPAASFKPENGQRAAADLQQGKPAEAIHHQEQAANELERFAQNLDQAAQESPDSKKAAVPTQQMVSRDAQRSANTLPTQQRKQQSEQARQLARRQRELRDAVQRSAQKPANEQPAEGKDPIEELFRLQTAVAEQAAELAHKIGNEQGQEAEVSQQAQQASQAAAETARQIQNGALTQARLEGQKTAEEIRQLASQLTQTPRRGNWQAFDPLRQARQLWPQQTEINRRLRLLEGDTRAQLAHQRNRQRHLQQEADALSQQLQRLAQETQSSPPMQSALQRAAGNGQQSKQAMQQARGQGQRGETPAEKQYRERAAQLLEQASQAVADAVRSQSEREGEGSMVKPGRSKAGEAAAKAVQQMAQAQGQLRRGQADQAQATMKQAAQSLAQAAQNMAASPLLPPPQKGALTGAGRQGGGLPDLSAYGLDKGVYAGKSWGELPGEVRTRIVQDMKTLYGEDYAQMIKSYFEQIADTKKK
jgi:hypothetical protein